MRSNARQHFAATTKQDRLANPVEMREVAHHDGDDDNDVPPANPNREFDNALWLQAVATEEWPVSPELIHPVLAATVPGKDVDPDAVPRPGGPDLGIANRFSAIRADRKGNLLIRDKGLIPPSEKFELKVQQQKQRYISNIT
jgi:hypothetical protein